MSATVWDFRIRKLELAEKISTELQMTTTGIADMSWEEYLEHKSQALKDAKKMVDEAFPN